MFSCFAKSAAGLAIVVAVVVYIGAIEGAPAATAQITASAILTPQIV